MDSQHRRIGLNNTTSSWTFWLPKRQAHNSTSPARWNWNERPKEERQEEKEAIHIWGRNFPIYGEEPEICDGGCVGWHLQRLEMTRGGSRSEWNDFRLFSFSTARRQVFTPSKYSRFFHPKFSIDSNGMKSYPRKNDGILEAPTSPYRQSCNREQLLA